MDVICVESCYNSEEKKASEWDFRFVDGRLYISGVGFLHVRLSLLYIALVISPNVLN